jgi:hypothetical protein
MIKLISYVASLLALGQAVAAAEEVTSFSERVEGILENPDRDNMTPEEVVDASKSGQFSTSPLGISAISPIHWSYKKANVYVKYSQVQSYLYPEACHLL